MSDDVVATVMRAAELAEEAAAAAVKPQDLTPEQAERRRVERTGDWPDPAWGPFHRHFASNEIHRDGGPECSQPGTPRRVYVFDEDTLDAYDKHITDRVRKEQALDQWVAAAVLLRKLVGHHYPDPLAKSRCKFDDRRWPCSTMVAASRLAEMMIAALKTQ